MRLYSPRSAVAERGCVSFRRKQSFQPLGSPALLDSINKGHFLVARCWPALVNVRAVGVKSQRHHGSTGGEQEEERHCCNDGLHGWALLVAAFEQR